MAGIELRSPFSNKLSVINFKNLITLVYLYANDNAYANADAEMPIRRYPIGPKDLPQILQRLAFLLKNAVVKETSI